MKIFYSEEHRRHYPPLEVFDGGMRVPYYENPDRMDRILSVLKKADWAEFAEPEDFGLDPILAVHDRGYTTSSPHAGTSGWHLTPGFHLRRKRKSSYPPLLLRRSRSSSATIFEW